LSFITDRLAFCDCWGIMTMAIVADHRVRGFVGPRRAGPRVPWDLVNDAPVNAGSMIDGRGLKPGDDKFSSVHPNTSWRAGLDYAGEHRPREAIIPRS